MDEDTTEDRRAGRTTGAGGENFYVKRINWLIEVGRTELIGEIVDDCERRRARWPG